MRSSVREAFQELLQFFQRLVPAEPQNYVMRMTIFFDEPPGTRAPFILRQHPGSFVPILCGQSLLPEVQWLANV
jgi:hypothetical protein